MNNIARLDDFRPRPYKVSILAALQQYAFLCGDEFKLAAFLGQLTTNQEETTWKPCTIARMQAACCQSTGQEASARWISYVLCFLERAGIVERRGKNGCIAEWRVRPPAQWADPDTLPALRQAVYRKPGKQAGKQPSRQAGQQAGRQVNGPRNARSSPLKRPTDTSCMNNNLATYHGWPTEPVQQPSQQRAAQKKDNQPSQRQSSTQSKSKPKGDAYVQTEKKLPAVVIYERVFERETLGRIDNLVYEVGTRGEPAQRRLELQLFFEVCVMGLQGYYVNRPPQPATILGWWRDWLKNPGKRRAPINSQQFFAAREAAHQVKLQQGVSTNEQSTVFDLLADQSTTEPESDSTRQRFDTEFAL